MKVHLPEMEIHQAGAAPDVAGSEVYVSEGRIRLAVAVGDFRKREADDRWRLRKPEYGNYDQLRICLINLEKVKRACFSGLPRKTRRAILQMPMACW